MSAPIEVVDDYRCCTLDDGHDGPCVWICSECHGTGYCWACGGPSGDDTGTGCSECDGTGYCYRCDEGMEVDQ